MISQEALLLELFATVPTLEANIVSVDYTVFSQFCLGAESFKTSLAVILPVSLMMSSLMIESILFLGKASPTVLTGD